MRVPIKHFRIDKFTSVTEKSKVVFFAAEENGFSNFITLLLANKNEFPIKTKLRSITRAASKTL